MYRTDKQFMTNPATAPSRIYIGFLAKTVVASDLEEKFKVHGKILGLVLQQGFAFIQYENNNQAQSAIQRENFTMLHGRKITVKQAMDKSQKGGQNQNQFKRNNLTGPSTAVAPPPPQTYNEPQKPNLNFKPPPQAYNEPQKPNLNFKPPQQEQSPSEIESEQPQVSKNVALQPPPNTGPQNQTALAQAPTNVQQQPPKNIIANAGIEGPPKHDISQDKRGKKRRVRSRDRFLAPLDRYRDDYYSYSAPAVIDQPDRNDCEIIVVSKLLTKYAEYIEQRLKSLGLIVDLLFPNEDVPIGRVLANISSRGCLFAILIMPQNEEHRSLTLNVLHGIPQEHRNMPIEDALVFITRNFDAYMRGDKTATETLGSGGVMNISDRHPTSVQLLLNLLAENRQITSVQYDRLVTYLQERREVQHKHEIDEGVDQSSQESNTKQAELQSRIMNILNKTANECPPTPVVEPPPPTETAPPLLKDPSVQKALDSLLGGEIFKSISSSM